MSALVKLGAVAAIGAVGTGVAVTTVSLKGGFSVSIPWTSLKDENNPSFSEGKIGKAFGIFLVGVYGEENKNEAWWKDSYARYLKDQKDHKSGETKFSDEFASEKIKDAFTGKDVATETTSGAKSLNLVCKDIYDQEKARVMVPEGDNVHSNFDLRRDFWKYCSPVWSSPQTIKVTGGSYNAGTIGKTKESELISTWQQDILWSIKEKEFFNLKESKITPLFFKNFREGKSSAKTLRNLCASAYEKTSSAEGSASDPNKVSADDVVKYCSFEDPSI